jgi:hypothetical protein
LVWLNGETQLRRARWVRHIVSVTISMLLVAGCIPGNTVEVTIPEKVEITVTGTLAGERTQVRECVWLIDRAGTKFDLVLPTGWSVAYGPVRLTDPNGKIFAEVGDILRVSGPTVIGETMCASGPPFIVEHIERL